MGDYEGNLIPNQSPDLKKGRLLIPKSVVRELVFFAGRVQDVENEGPHLYYNCRLKHQVESRKGPKCDILTKYKKIHKQY